MYQFVAKCRENGSIRSKPDRTLLIQCHASRGRNLVYAAFSLTYIMVMPEDIFNPLLDANDTRCAYLVGPRNDSEY